MTKKQLEKEADKWLRKYLLCYDCEKKCNCIETNSYCEQQVLKAYVDSAEPREKRIEELEKEVELWKKASENNSYKAFQFEKDNTKLKKQQFSLRNERNTFLAQNEHYEKDLIDFNENFTKAKEHIRTLISCLIDWVQEGDKDYCHIAEAEQFLNEVEK